MVGGSLFDAFRMTRALTLRRAIEVGRARAPRPRSSLPAARHARRLCAAKPAAASADARWRGRARRWRSTSRAAWRTCTPRRRARSSTGALRPRPADARAGRCESGPVPAFGYVGRGVSRARERERGAACARALTAPPSGPVTSFGCVRTGRSAPAGFERAGACARAGTSSRRTS